MKLACSKQAQLFIALALSLVLFACNNSEQVKSTNSSAPTIVINEALAALSQVPDPSVKDCSSCHQQQYSDWLNSQHAIANRLIGSADVQAAFSPKQLRTHGKIISKFEISSGGPLIIQSESGASKQVYHPEAVIGVLPEYQYLIPFAGGRLQVLDEAYDPHKKEWFNVFGSEVREPQEWGHWTQRGNNWNSQCAFCHMTGLQKNYSAESDSYDTKWDAMGISCAQCHGDLSEHKKNPQAPITKLVNKTDLVMDNCAACHARREELTGEFLPGEKFNDHYRLTLADAPSMYFADGQQQDEVFVYGSFLSSRMAHKGITCQDCHNPHSGKLKIPADNNQLCLSCHAKPGVRGAIVIDPTLHSNHKTDSRGNACIECHMPERQYMQRDSRRDHYFGVPDPVLTKEINLPNACNQCHKDRDTDWAIEWTNRWYGKKMDRPTRQRARLIDRAQHGDASVLPELIAFIKKEEIPFWRATLVSLLRPWAADTVTLDLLKASLKDSDPLVRSVAIQALEPIPELQAELSKLRSDNSRLVRLDATFATAASDSESSPEYSELLKYLANMSDQPAGIFKAAQLEMRQSDYAQAEQLLKKMLSWDPSALNFYLFGQFLHSAEKSSEAEAAFKRAVELAPENPEYAFDLGLLYSELGQLNDSVLWLEKAVKLDPQFGRALYNLGLAYAQQERLELSIETLITAQQVLASAEVSYALATVYMRKGDVSAAQLAASKSLLIDPNYLPAREFLGQLNSQLLKH